MHPEITNNPPQPTDSIDSTHYNRKKNTLGNSFSSAIFYLSILFFIIGFNFSDVMVGNWYQQFMPNIGSKQITDIIFIDSLTGFAIASKNVNPDTSSILRTTDGGDSWQIIFTQGSRRFSRVKFINNDTGFVCGGTGAGTPYLYKTINGGINWSVISSSGCAFWNDMHVLSNDTIWVVDSDGLCGGVFFTSNGGANWVHQINLGSQNPDHIYMYNGRFGFITEANNYLRRTTNSGLNWDVIPNDNGFRDMFFIDSLKGWKCGTETDSIRATTNGGVSWFKQLLPPTGGFFNISAITNFAFVNKDTIYGVGPRAGTTLGFRGMIYKTINGGQNWGYQIPDTNTITISRYNFVDFYNKNTGWAYSGITGVHTILGGDPVWYIGIQQISSNIPKDYELKQNYPNPFNPRTVIPYSIKRSAYVKLTAYDILGRETQKLVDSHHNAGEYEVDFMGKFSSSGIYFYRIEITDDASKQLFTETRKMILIK